MPKPTIEQLAGSLSVLTCLVIQGNGAKVAVGEMVGGGYGFEIYRIERENYRPLVTSNGDFDSDDEARKSGEEVINLVRSWDLTDKIPAFMQGEYNPPEGSTRV